LGPFLATDVTVEKTVALADLLQENLPDFTVPLGDGFKTEYLFLFPAIAPAPADGQGIGCRQQRLPVMHRVVIDDTGSTGSVQCDDHTVCFGVRARLYEREGKGMTRENAASPENAHGRPEGGHGLRPGSTEPGDTLKKASVRIRQIAVLYHKILAILADQSGLSKSGGESMKTSICQRLPGLIQSPVRLSVAPQFKFTTENQESKRGASFFFNFNLTNRMEQTIFNFYLPRCFLEKDGDSLRLHVSDAKSWEYHL